MEVGKSLLEKSKVSLYDSISRVIHEFDKEIEEKNIQFETIFSTEARTKVIEADKEKVAEVLKILVDNAIRYTPSKGSISIECKIVLHPIEHVEQYQIVIQDSGIGMTKDELEGIFKHSFQRGDRAKKVHATGKGIGLLFAKRIINAHSGSIQINSAGVDHGTKVLILFPCKK